MSQQSLNSKPPILVIDKRGIFGVALVAFLSREHFVIFVSNAKFSNKRIVRVAYGNRIPRIPNNTFSHILLIDCQENDLADFLPSIIQKAKQDKAQVVVIKNLYLLSKAFLRNLMSEQSNLKFLLYGDVYSDTYAFSNRLYTLFRGIKEKNKLHLLQSGLHLLYPASFSDIATTIDRLLFAGENSTYCLFPKNGVSEISIARLLHNKFPDVEISFSEKQHVQSLIIPEPSIETITNNEAVRHLDQLSLNRMTLDNNVELEEIKRERRLTTFWNRCLLIGMLTILFLFLLPTAFFIVGSFSVLSSIRSLEDGQVSLAKQDAQLADESFSLLNTTAIPLTTVGNKIGLTTQVNELANITQIAQQGIGVLENLSDGFSLFSDTGNTTSEYMGLAKMRFADQQLEELIAEKKLYYLPEETQQQLMNATIGFSSIAGALPTALGVSQAKTYLVLFENSNELRPGGGFIGSYGLVTLANGKVKDFSVQDIYSLDGQLQGHVSPPEPLQQYLGIQNWFLRDSNFAVDQTQNSATEDYFYTLESGKKVDGVITIDTPVLEDLLNITGPIAVSSYQQQITSQNFFQIFEDHSEQNFTPGSEQKKAFLSAFATALEGDLREHPLSIKTLQSFWLQQLSEKHMSVWLSNPQVNNMLQSSLNDIFTPASKTVQAPTLHDFFGVNEANIGLNKVNHYIQRSFDHEVLIDANGGVTHTVTMTYTNNSMKSSPYGGDYKVFIRNIIPHDAIFKSIAFNGKDQPFFLTTTNQQPIYKGKDFLPENTLSVYPEDTDGQSSYGFFTIIPMQSTVTITISYTLNQSVVSNQSKTNYQLSLLKQFGTNSDPVTVRVKTASDFKLQQESFNGVVAAHSAVTQFDLTTDQLLGLLVVQ